MRKIEKLQKEFERLNCEIAKRQSVKDLPEVQETLRRLHGQRSYIKAELAKYTIKSAKLVDVMNQRRIKSNYNRSEKNKRNWRYWKAVQRNYYSGENGQPFKSLKEIRHSHKLHRQGLEQDIPDAAWNNPSP